jgi:hypothetical protein
VRWLASVLLGVGLVLILVGQFLPERGPDAVWTKQQAAERRDALVKGHDARGRKAAQENKHKSPQDHDSHKAHSHGPEISDEEFDAAEERFKRSNEDIQSARSAASLPARIFFWSGLAAAVTGLACYGYERATA